MISESVSLVWENVLSFGTCLRSRNSWDVPQYSRLGPKEETWTPKVRTFDRLAHHSDASYLHGIHAHDSTCAWIVPVWNVKPRAWNTMERFGFRWIIDGIVACLISGWQSCVEYPTVQTISQPNSRGGSINKWDKNVQIRRASVKVHVEYLCANIDWA